MESRTQAIGRELFARIEADRGAFDPDRWTGALLDWSLRHEDARLQLFRFVDVLPALAHDADVLQHLGEYFAGRPLPFATLVRLGLGAARWSGPLGDAVVGSTLRYTVRRLARRFIAGSSAAEARAAALAARAAGQAFTLDVLGEACVSDAEADAYQRRYLGLLEQLAREATTWPAVPVVDRAPWGPLPRVNLSVKLSALDPWLDPVAPARAWDAMQRRLAPIFRTAMALGAHVQVDMEERRLRDLTLDLFTALCDEPEFRGWRDVGVVLQAYLRDADDTARRLVDWAGRRGTPLTIRLVKGAYWDYETAHARLQSWPVPVFDAKAETDAAFERLTRYLLRHAAVVDLALGSHNVRSIAHAIAAREALGVPAAAVEFQTLYGMAAPLARALTQRGERVRIYMPFGELIPGMGYLVRRLLENTSNESFLRRGFAEHQPVDVLLAPPADAGGAAPRRETEEMPPETRRQRMTGFRRHLSRLAPWRSVGGSRDGRHDAQPTRRDIAPTDSSAGAVFGSEPYVDFAVAENREAMRRALASVSGRLGRDERIVIGGEPVVTGDWIVSHDPSRAGVLVGRAAAARVDDADRAVEAAAAAWPAWRDLGAPGRSLILGRVADTLRARRAELAAWIVLEAGKPWSEADADVAEAIDFVEYYRRQAVALQAPLTLGALAGEDNRYYRDPRGVVATIAPWNFPLAILTGMTAAALATGNTVVMKPAEQTPIVAARLMEALAAAGVPAGVVNYLPGRGAVAGDRLVRHPRVALVAFTGSLDVGTRIYATAAQTGPGARQLTRVVAEMGGKNAIVVDADADLDEAVQGILASMVGYAGQKCSACSRVIVVGTAYERLLARLGEAARTVPMGPADEPGTIVGPLIDAASAERVSGYIDLGKRLARPVLIREVPERLVRLGGHYVGPAIFADVPPACALAREEIFGPVLSVMPAASFDAALAIALDIEYGLTGGVFSRSPLNIERARRAFGVGNLYINRAITGARVGRQPFGGRQLSGIGYQAGGPDYLVQFVESRVVSENTLRRGFASGLS